MSSVLCSIAVRPTSVEGVRFRDAVFLPDGDSILALSDESGELEFVTLPADGIGERVIDEGAETVDQLQPERYAILGRGFVMRRGAHAAPQRLFLCDPLIIV